MGKNTLAGALSTSIAPGPSPQLHDPPEAAGAEAAEAKSLRLSKLARASGEAAEVPQKAVAAAAEAQLAVVHRVSFQEAESEDGEGATTSGIGGNRTTTMPISAAQRSSVVLIKGFLSADEVAAVHAAAGRIIGDPGQQVGARTNGYSATAVAGIAPAVVCPAGQAVGCSPRCVICRGAGFMTAAAVACAEAKGAGGELVARSSPAWEQARSLSL